MALKAKISRARLMRVLQAVAPNIEKELAAAQLEAGEMLAERIQARAPFKTGDYMQSIHAARLADVPPEKRKRNVIASQTKDKNAVAILADFYWRFLEFGTVKTSAQPHVFPTYRQSKREIRRQIATVINRAVRKTAGKG